jgi:hypothetical protein
MNKLTLGLAVALALTACGKKDKDAAKKDTPPAADPATKPAEPPATKPAEPPPPPADPTASWTEQKGEGFTVMAANAPKSEQMDAPTPLGPQKVTAFGGFEPAGYKGAMQVGVTDLSALKGDKRKPDQIIKDSVAGLMANMPGVKVDSEVKDTGGEAGTRLALSGTHPQGGPFKMVARILLKNKKLYVVQALRTQDADQPLVDKFVDSFKID